jgi:hypothetical protein
VSDIGDPTGAQLAAEVGNLDPNARRVLGTLAVLGRAPVSVATLGEVSGAGDVRSGLDQLDRQRLIVREPGDRASITPGVHGRLKSLLATDDEVDAVLAGLTRRADDGRLTAGDLDAVDEATRVAAETGRWPQVLRLSQASEPTLAATQRVDVWTRIVERRLEAARALGDQGAVAHAQRELDNLAAMDAPTRVVTTTAEEREERAPPPDRTGVAWPLVLLVGLALAAAGTGLGYLLGSETSDATTVTESSPAETTVETETATGPTTTVTTTETETTTETQTVTEAQTVTETVPGR